MKKTLSLILAFIMTFTVCVAVLPTTVFAAATGTYRSDTEAKEAGMYFRLGAENPTDGTKYAATLNDVKSFFTGAQTTPVTIYQIRDYQGDQAFRVYADNQIDDLTIDGQGFSYISTKTASADWRRVINIRIRNYEELCVGATFHSSDSDPEARNMFFEALFGIFIKFVMKMNYQAELF